jgi:hypothetical protein
VSKQYPTPETSLKAVVKLLARPCLDDTGRKALLHRYVDLSRQLRVLRVSEWEVARGLVEDWHGTPDELIVTARELTK